MLRLTDSNPGVGVERELGGCVQCNLSIPVRVELELYVVRQQRSSHLGKQTVRQVSSIRRVYTRALLKHIVSSIYNIVRKLTFLLDP